MATSTKKPAAGSTKRTTANVKATAAGAKPPAANPTRGRSTGANVKGKGPKAK